MKEKEIMKTVKPNGEEYWQQHLNACNKSGQQKSVYCREHQLNYEQMMYWQKKLNNAKPASFVPVKLKNEQMPFNEQFICTLTMPSGCILKIYDERALSIILDKWK
jgi:hypothetical protein